MPDIKHGILMKADDRFAMKRVKVEANEMERKWKWIMREEER